MAPTALAIPSPSTPTTHLQGPNPPFGIQKGTCPMAFYRFCPYGLRVKSTGSHYSSRLASLEPLPSLFIEPKGAGRGTGMTGLQ